MANDFVVEVGDIADEMYFIKKGVVEVIATDNVTVIAYLTEGAYFGEIG
jgi:CRP-like cAMP-binding protein